MGKDQPSSSVLPERERVQLGSLAECLNLSVLFLQLVLYSPFDILVFDDSLNLLMTLYSGFCFLY